MVTQLRLGDTVVDVVLKDIRNVHVSVYPPTGRVRISAPSRMKLDTIRVFAISKLGWIKQQQQKLRDQERETPREYLNRESHYVWGRRYLLKAIEADEAPAVELKQRHMILRIRPATSRDRIRSVVDAWYREQIKTAVQPLVAKWEPRIGVQVSRVFVQRMKTRWGSCNPRAASIRLNTDLAMKPPECLEYIVVHEMVHLLEPTHGAQFVGHMNRLMPQWRAGRQQLSHLPIRHQDWVY